MALPQRQNNRDTGSDIAFTPFSDMTYILELDKQSVILLGQLLHMRLIDEPDDEMAQTLFQELMSQTTFISRNRLDHGVYLNELEIPTHTTFHRSTGLFYRFPPTFYNTSSEAKILTPQQSQY